MTNNFKAITPENYDNAFKLQTACHSYPWSRKVFLDCLSEPYFAEQLYEDDRVVGYFVGLQVSVEATLMDIGIDPDHRQKGLGKALLKRFLLLCNEKQLSEVWLEVRLSNEHAIGMYKNMGFVVVEQRKGYYPASDGKEDALIMKLELGC